MLNDHGQTGQRSLLSDASAPKQESAPKKAADGVSAAGVTTGVPEWLRDELQDYAAHEMPGASWDEVVLLALAVGLGALGGAGNARRLNGFGAPQSLAAPPVPEPKYPFERKHVPAFKALLAAVEAGALVLDAASIESITGRMGSESLRGVGAFMATLARNSPVVGLSVEALGRKPGRVMMDYRISKAG